MLDVNLPPVYLFDDVENDQRQEEEELIKVSNDDKAEKREKQKVPPSYVIHRKRVDESQAISSAGTSNLKELLLFCFNKNKNVQMLLLSNHLVRSGPFLTKSVPKQIFMTLGLDGNEPDYYLKIAHDLICKVKSPY